MLGVLTDLALVAVIGLFGWGGYRLGYLTSGVRLVAGLLALAVAVLLRPLGAGILGAIGFEEGLASFVAMIAFGIVGYLLAARLVEVAALRLPDDLVYSRDAAIGSVLGGLTGLLWAWVMLPTLLLMPGDNAVARGAIESRAGGLMIAHNEPVLRWVSETFERYTQALPKDPDGALVGIQERPVDFPADVAEVDADGADELLAAINARRNEAEARDLVFNVEVGRVAEQHALQVVRSGIIALSPAGGTPFEERMVRVLGDPEEYEDTAMLIVWARDEASAITGMLRAGAASGVVLNTEMDEVGIGVVDAGWFFGRIYVLGFIDRPRLRGDDDLDDGGIEAPAVPDVNEMPRDDLGGDDPFADEEFDDGRLDEEFDDDWIFDDGDDPFGPDPFDDDFAP